MRYCRLLRRRADRDRAEAGPGAALSRVGWNRPLLRADRDVLGQGRGSGAQDGASLFPLHPAVLESDVGAAQPGQLRRRLEDRPRGGCRRADSMRARSGTAHPGDPDVS